MYLHPPLILDKDANYFTLYESEGISAMNEKLNEIKYNTKFILKIIRFKCILTPKNSRYFLCVYRIVYHKFIVLVLNIEVFQIKFS